MNKDKFNFENKYFQQEHFFKLKVCVVLEMCLTLIKNFFQPFE